MNKSTHDVSSFAGSDGLWQELLIEAQGKPWLLRLLGEKGAALYLRFRAANERLQRLRPGQMRRLQHKLGLGLAGAALMLALSGGPAAGAPANVITVDGTVCTLSDAITTANTDTATGACTTGSGADILNITNDIDLTSVLPDITTEMTIEGGGHTIQRTGGNAFRVLKVTDAGNLTLNEATISGGSTDGDGGGIFNEGTLMVQNSTISGNSADGWGGGIRSSGIVAVQNSTLSDNTTNKSGGGIRNRKGELTIQNSILYGNTADNSGGGIASDGTLLVQNSTLSGNSAYFGGGITNDGMLTVQNSTLSGNSGGYGSGGIENNDTLTVQNSTISGNSGRVTAGGIGSYDTLMVQNSTISDNVSGFGGGIWSSGEVTVQSSTLSGNSATTRGGGIINLGTLTVRNSLISGNAGRNSGNEILSGDNATIVAASTNLFGHSGENDAQAFINFTPSGSDINATSDGMALALDAILDTTLAENDTHVNAGVSPGSPVLTHSLVTGSAAIDAVPNEACTEPPISSVDQRGFPRNVDGDGVASSTECDIGAFEKGESLSIRAFLPLVFK